MRYILLCVLGFAVPAVSLSSAADPPDVPELLKTIRAAGPEGRGADAAAKAYRALVAAPPSVLPAILNALDGASPVASNWLRSAADVIGERALAGKVALPLKELEAFATDAKKPPRSRRLAYEWLSRGDPTAPGRLLPAMLDDPAAELRRDAVAVVIAAAERHAKAEAKPEALAAFRKALVAARDLDQVTAIATRLGDLGGPIDVAAHLGFVRDWHVAGPFDNARDAGFATAFPPEAKVDLSAELKGKGGAAVRWRAHHTTDPMAVVDLNEAVAKQDDVVAYALVVVESKTERPVELRTSSNNTYKVFLNGRQVIAHDTSHHGMRADQEVGKGTLKAGRNEILVKVCQDDGTQSKVRWWSFQLRVCDELGGAVPVRVVSPEPKEKP